MADNVSENFWKSATYIIKATEKHEFLTKMVDGVSLSRQATSLK